MDTVKLTGKKAQVYNFICDFCDNHGYAPTVREICEGVGLKSTSSVAAHIKSLKELGLIEMQAMRPRTINVMSIKNKEEKNGNKSLC